MRRIRTIAGALSLLASLIPGMASAQYWHERSAPPPMAYERAGYAPRGSIPPPAYHGPPPEYRNAPPRTYRRCNRGAGGAIIGAIAGGLLGNAVAGRGDHGAGTVLGAGAGALSGREIGRDC